MGPGAAQVGRGRGLGSKGTPNQKEMFRMPSPCSYPLPPLPSSQRNVMKQNHGLETGLDVHLVPLCKAALPDTPGTEAEPVYAEIEVQNTHR